MPKHNNTPPEPATGRETWVFSREEIIAILRREVAAKDGGKFFVWGIEDSHHGGDERVTSKLPPRRDGVTLLLKHNKKAMLLVLLPQFWES
jgi:hypothetical protein